MGLLAKGNRLDQWLMIAALMFGFSLRIYDLDAYSLWNDEAGQALAAIQSNLNDTIMHIRSHAGAMPADYFITRLAIQISTSEFAIRFPAVFASTIAMASLGALAKLVINAPVAAIAVWIMAISPDLVYYAREARPYAALLMFSLLSTYVLMLALQSRSTKKWWLLWGAAMVVGAYFHIYVLWTAFFGFAYLTISIKDHGIASKLSTSSVTSFVMTLVLIFLLVLPGYRYFVAEDSFTYELFQFGGNLWSITAGGLGWQFDRSPVQSMLLGLLTVIGCVVAPAKYRTNTRLMALLFGIPLIICAILLADTIQGYWYLQRQLIHLQPIVQLFTAIGCCYVAQAVFGLLRQRNIGWTPPASGILTLIVATTISATAASIGDTYSFPKGNGQQIIELLARYEDGGAVFVRPPYETKIYAYYALSETPAGNTLVSALQPAEWEEILAHSSEPGEDFVIAPPDEIAVFSTKLRAAGYHPILEPSVTNGYMRSLWGRP